MNDNTEVDLRGDGARLPDMVQAAEQRLTAAHEKLDAEEAAKLKELRLIGANDSEIAAEQVRYARERDKLRQPKVGTDGTTVIGYATIVIGYVCALMALFFFPPAFALAGFVVGAVNIRKGKVWHGVAQIVLSVACFTIALLFALGQAMTT
jgi:hypothetical protein